MKKFLDEIKMAKKLEWFLLLAAAMLLFVSFGGDKPSSTLRTETEQRLISILSRIDGAGKTDVMISNVDGKTNVLVVSEGANDMNVQLRILQAVSVMCNSELSDIEIIPFER